MKIYRGLGLNTTGHFSVVDNPTGRKVKGVSIFFSDDSSSKKSSQGFFDNWF